MQNSKTVYMKSFNFLHYNVLTKPRKKTLRKFDMTATNNLKKFGPFKFCYFSSLRLNIEPFY